MTEEFKVVVNTNDDELLKAVQSLILEKQDEILRQKQDEECQERQGCEGEIAEQEGGDD